METTEIYLRAFNVYMTLKLRRKKHLSLRECVEYVQGSLEWETAMIKEINHNGNVIKNDSYEDPEEICFKQRILERA